MSLTVTELLDSPFSVPFPQLRPYGPSVQVRHTSAWSTEADFIATAHRDLARNEWVSSAHFPYDSLFSG